MALYPRATKTSLARLIRSKGFTIPSIRQACLTHFGRSYWLHWVAADGSSFHAYYTAAAGKPVLQVNEQWINLTMAEVIHFELVEER
ncbi:MAG: hypothetical protein PUC36_00585 [Clostridiales bacterium]|nr:hypothetical protein [Clostridiales bacterium]